MGATANAIEVRSVEEATRILNNLSKKGESVILDVTVIVPSSGLDDYLKRMTNCRRVEFIDEATIKASR